MEPAYGNVSRTGEWRLANCRILAILGKFCSDNKKRKREGAARGQNYVTLLIEDVWRRKYAKIERRKMYRKCNSSPVDTCLGCRFSPPPLSPLPPKVLPGKASLTGTCSEADAEPESLKLRSPSAKSSFLSRRRDDPYSSLKHSVIRMVGLTVPKSDNSSLHP